MTAVKAVGPLKFVDVDLLKVYIFDGNGRLPRLDVVVDWPKTVMTKSLARHERLNESCDVCCLFGCCRVVETI